MSRSIGGALDQAALSRLHFHALDREQQAAAIRRLADAGHGDHTIAQATGLSAEQIRRVVADSASGKWIGNRWYPQWRLDEIREKYRDPPDVDLGDPERAP
jgi:hypothetical protein